MNYIKKFISMTIIIMVIFSIAIKTSILLNLNYTIVSLLFFTMFHTCVRVEIIDYYQNRFGIRLHLRL